MARFRPAGLAALIVALGLAVLSFAALLPAESAGCTTEVTAGITADTTWTVAGSPYCLGGGILVSTGVALSVEQGVVIKGAVGTFLEVRGNLVAQGVPDNKVYFTSLEDNTVGSTTGSGSPAPGDWSGIILNGDNANLTLDYAEVRYAGGVNLGAVRITSGQAITITNSVLRKSASYGVVNFGSSPGRVVISASEVLSNSMTGIDLRGAIDPVISGNTFRGNGGYAVYLSYAMLSGSFGANGGSGNGSDAIGLAYVTLGDTTLAAQ